MGWNCVPRLNRIVEVKKLHVGVPAGFDPKYLGHLKTRCRFFTLEQFIRFCGELATLAFLNHRICLSVKNSELKLIQGDVWTG